MRYIPMPTCLTCPHKDHRGAFAKISREPYCRLMQRVLPHELVRGLGNMVAAQPTYVIPNWCPLPELPNELAK